MELTHSDRAQVLVEALPYIQRYYASMWWWSTAAGRRSMSC